jgi:hypothetical protein
MWLIYGVLQLCGDRTVTYAYTFRFFGFLEILKINLGQDKRRRHGRALISSLHIRLERHALVSLVPR